MLESIKIAGVDYKVEVVDGFEMSESEKRRFIKDGHDLEELTKWGEAVYHESAIRLWSGLSDEKKKQTLIHEMLHAVFHEAGYDEENEDEVNRLSIVLHQVLKDNDFSWLQGEEYEIIETHDRSGNVTTEKVKVTH